MKPKALIEQDNGWGVFLNAFAYVLKSKGNSAAVINNYFCTGFYLEFLVTV